MSHVMTVTKVADEESDDTEYEITHDELTKPQLVWFECTRPWCVSLDAEYPEDEWDFDRHGHWHERIDGVPMIESDRCICQDGNDYDGSKWQLAEELGLGEHRVDVTYEGDGYWLWFPASDKSL